MSDGLWRTVDNLATVLSQESFGILDAVWAVVDAANNVAFANGSSWTPSDQEKKVWAALFATRDLAIQNWLGHEADAHLRNSSSHGDQTFSCIAMPPTIVSTSARPIVFDQDGVGQLEFIATVSSGREYKATRVVPLPDN